MGDDAKKIDDYAKTLMGRFESIKKSCADLFVSFGEKDSLSDDDAAKFFSAYVFFFYSEFTLTIKLTRSNHHRLHKFALNIRNTQVEIQKMKELEEKKAKKKQEEEKKKSAKSKNVFENYTKLKQGNAEDIVAMMTKKSRVRRGRRSKGSPRTTEVKRAGRTTSVSRRRQHGKSLADAAVAASGRRLRGGRRRNK